MKHLVRNVLKVLDGKPRGAKGQSLVELAFSAPILFLMIITTAEVGFLANNYLILLDAVREGGRFATALSPLTWNDAQDTRNMYRTACADEQSGFFNMQSGESPSHSTPHGPSGPGISPAYVLLGQKNPTKGFFDGAMCQTVSAMNPLKFDLSVDDVVVSAVSFINSCSGGLNACYFTDGNGTHYDQPIGTHSIIVTGRWPLSNRYCPGPGGPSVGSGEDQRDPFVFPGGPSAATLYAQHAELANSLHTDIRGFVVTGFQTSQETPTSCIGSKFHVGGGDAYDLETRFNQLSDTKVRDRLPNGGMVIVEMTWQHHQLFHFPLLTLLGDPKLYVWMMFPVSSAEPTATTAP